MGSHCSSAGVFCVLIALQMEPEDQGLRTNCTPVARLKARSGTAAVY